MHNLALKTIYKPTLWGEITAFPKTKRTAEMCGVIGESMENHTPRLREYGTYLDKYTVKEIPNWPYSQ